MSISFSEKKLHLDNVHNSQIDKNENLFSNIDGFEKSEQNGQNQRACQVFSDNTEELAMQFFETITTRNLNVDALSKVFFASNTKTCETSLTKTSIPKLSKTKSPSNLLPSAQPKILVEAPSKFYQDSLANSAKPIPIKSKLPRGVVTTSQPKALSATAVNFYNMSVDKTLIEEPRETLKPSDFISNIDLGIFCKKHTSFFDGSTAHISLNSNQKIMKRICFDIKNAANKNNSVLARNLYEQGKELEFENIFLHNVYIKAAGQLGDIEGVKNAYRAAILINPQDMISHNSYIKAAGQLGDIEGAKRAYEVGIRIDANNIVMHQSMVDVLVGNGLFTEALKIFDEEICFPLYKGTNLGYDLHGYSHGAGICTLLRLREYYPEAKSFIFMTGKGLHSNNSLLYGFQQYFKDFIAKEMPGWRCAQDWSNQGLITVFQS